jgi:outer membrane cobalamin receptor
MNHRFSKLLGGGCLEVVYDEPLLASAFSGQGVDVRVASEKAQADIALLHPEQIVEVTATRKPEDLLTSASSVNVVSRSELEARNVQTIDEGLDQVPGLYVQRIQGLADTEASVYLRGFNGPNRTLVLLDGQPINDSFFGTVPWNVVPADEVETIEVVRGPFSSLYGGNALGGVINIRTRRPTHRSFDLGEEYGSNATNRILAHYADSLGKLGVKNRWTGAITARYSRATFETDQNLDTIHGVPGSYDPFFLVGANLTYRIGQHFELTGTGTNLLDRKYYQFYLTPGRQSYAGVRFRY